MNQLYAIAAGVLWESGDAHITVPAAFATFAKAAAPVAVAAMWQGAAVAVCMALFLRFALRVSAAHRFTAWAVGFAVVAGLPFLPLFSHVAASAGPALASPVVGPRPWFELDSRWGLAIAALWLAASTIRLVELFSHSMRLRKLWKSAMPIEDSDLAESLAAALPKGSSVKICTTRELNRPSMIGFFAPRILVPEWLVDRLTPEELKQVVLHEGEHLRRRDDWTNLLQKFCLVLFPLNPALAWMERQLCREREMACDEGVVLRTQAPRAYAACLTSLAERGLQRDLEHRAETLSLAAWRRRPELVHRVHSILRRKQALHPVAARALLATAGCGLLLGSVELARCPQVVAFVAAPNPTAVAKLESWSNSAGRASGVVPGFRAFPIKAILPGSSLAPVEHSARRAQPTDDFQVASRETGTGPREQLIKATMPSAAAKAADQDSDQNSGQNSGAEYIVLTTWEQVEAAPHHSREVADYDAGEAAQPEAGQNSKQDGSQGSSVPSADSPTQIRVTRLIFRIDPAEKAASSKEAHKNNSQSDQPVAVPLESGWLVFQL